MFAFQRQMRRIQTSARQRATWVKPRLEVLEDRTVLSGFTDGFEGATLNSFWTTTAQSGYVAFPSTGQVHSGGQSVQLNSTETGLNKFISLIHTFATPTYGHVSVWFYDNGAGVSSSNYIGLQLSSTQDSNARDSLFTFDYDLGPGQNGSTYYINPNSTDTISTGVERTQGWHQFTINATPSLATYYVDGTAVYNTTVSQPFDQILLFMQGPYWRPAWTANFDDFEFQPEGQPDIVPTSLTWNATQGGVDFKYKVTGAALPQDTTAQFYWASGTTEDTILEPATTPITIPKTVQVDQEQTVPLAPSDFPGGPAPDAKYLLAVVDPDNKIDEGSTGEQNNLLPLAVPLQIQQFQQTTYELVAEPNPAMPQITANAQFVNLTFNPTASTTFHWQAKIAFDASRVAHGPARQFNYDYPVKDVSGSAEYTPDFQNGGTQVIRGGNLTFVLKANVAGFDFEVKSDTLTIQGHNPSEDAVRSYIRQLANARELGNYIDDLGRIARQESRYNQFLNNMPYFSEDNLGGAGLYQITPATTGDLVWNWQSNVAAGVDKFASTVSRSQRLNVIIQGPTFRTRVQEWNNGRVSHGLPAIPITQIYVPPLNAEQIRRNAIRGFNGYGGIDLHLGGVLNEYTLAFNSDGLLDLTYNAATRRWEARWVEVPVAKRPQKFGDPDYVNHVLSQNP